MVDPEPQKEPIPDPDYREPPWWNEMEKAIDEGLKGKKLPELPKPEKPENN